MGVVPEFRRRVHALLYIRVLATELLDLFLNCILHEMLPCLALAHHGALTADWVQLIMLVIVGIGSNVLQLLLDLRRWLPLSLELVSKLTSL